MKKKFQKISKFVFIAGMVALITLLLVVFNTSEVIEGPLAAISMVCMVMILITGIFAMTNFVVAFAEGWKTNRKDFLKHFFVQIVIMMLIYSWADSQDGIREVSLLKMVLQPILMSAAIIGGEYMITKHKDEEMDELHF